MNNKEYKEWLRFDETKAALAALKEETHECNLNLRSVTKDQFEKELGCLEGMEYSIQFLEELGDGEESI